MVTDAATVGFGAVLGGLVGALFGGAPGLLIGTALGGLAGHRASTQTSAHASPDPSGSSLPVIAPQERWPKPQGERASLSETADEAQLRANAENLSDAFYRRLVEVAERLGFSSAEALAKILAVESKMDPKARNPRTGPPIALGLNQLVRKAAVALGMPGEQWERMHLMDPADQLLWVERYFSYWRRVFPDVPWHEFTGYLANFAPGKLLSARAKDSKLYVAPSAEYALNAGFDTARKGHITLGDLTYAVSGPLHPAISARVARARAQLATAT